MRGKAPVPVLSAVFLLATALAVPGCAGPQESGPGWTAQPDTTSQPDASPQSSAGPGAATAPATDGATATSTGPSPAATAAAWKAFSDPAKTVSFELPQDWIAQSVSPDEGTLPGALKIEVKKPDGTFMAALRTGLPPSAADCPESARKPYTVISSLPVDVPAGDGEGTIPPRMVFRVIQGYRFFGSYGITNMVGGAGNQACELRNVVRGPAGKGDWSFGDLVSLRAFAPDEKVAPAKAFETLGQAAEYVDGSTDFANVQRMLMSLEIKN